MDVLKQIEIVVKILKVLKDQGISLGNEIKDVIEACLKIKDEIASSLK